MGRATTRQRMMLRANGADWYRIKNLADGTAEINIYDEIGYLGVTAQGFINELKLIDAERISLRINSPGGEIFDGIAIMNAIRSHPAMVTTFVDGVAASIASVIAMAGDRVVMMPNSQLMIHDGSGLCVGDAQDMRDMADLLDKQSDNIASIYRDKAGGLAKTWRTRMKAETWYSAEEAVKAGLADEVAKKPMRRSEEMSNRWDLSIYRYAGRNEAPTPPLTNQDEGADEEEMPDEEMPPEEESPVNTVVPVHHTDTVDIPWDNDANERRLPSPMSLDVARRYYAWYDSEQVEDGMIPKQAGKLGHHEVDADGNPGPANLAGVRNALSRLPQSDIPRSDWDAIRTKLQAHLEDGRPPEEEEARANTAMTGWSPDLFRTAMAKAAGLPPEDLPDTFRNAVTSAAGSASAIPANAEPAPDPAQLGWSDPTPPPEQTPTAGGVFREAVTSAAGTASAIPQRPEPAPDPSRLGWSSPTPPPPPAPRTAGGMFRDAVTAAAGSAAAIPARAATEPDPESLGWQQPAPPAEPQPQTAGDVFRAVLAREANRAPAVITKPDPEPERDPYDPTVVIRALREANQ